MTKIQKSGQAETKAEKVRKQVMISLASSTELIQNRVMDFAIKALVDIEAGTVNTLVRKLLQREKDVLFRLRQTDLPPRRFWRLTPTSLYQAYAEQLISLHTFVKQTVTMIDLADAHPLAEFLRILATSRRLCALLERSSSGFLDCKSEWKTFASWLHEGRDWIIAEYQTKRPPLSKDNVRNWTVAATSDLFYLQKMNNVSLAACFLQNDRISKEEVGREGIVKMAEMLEKHYSLKKKELVVAHEISEFLRWTVDNPGKYRTPKYSFKGMIDAHDAAFSVSPEKRG